jgi:hypothetical protein
MAKRSYKNSTCWLDMRWFFVKDAIFRDKVDLQRVDTKNNVADGFTKPPEKEAHERFITKNHLMSSQQVLFLYDLFAINNCVLMLSVMIAIASPAPGRLRAVAAKSTEGAIWFFGGAPIRCYARK